VNGDEERVREEAVAWLVLLGDAPDDAGRQAEFRTWLAASPRHRAAWVSVSRTDELLAETARSGAARAAQAATEPTPGAGASWTRGTARRFAAAALIAACLAFAFLPALSLRLEADHVTQTAQIKSLRLDDGSTVGLGPDGAIALDFSAGERRVRLLAGQALFDVAPNPQRPFRVVTRDQTTTVVGTRFDVMLLENSTSVAVAHGHVQVSAAVGGASFGLSPGDWVRVKRDGTSESGSGLPDYLLAGPEGRLAVRNRPVAEVVERLRPWFAGKIIVTDDHVGGQPVTGVFDAADPAKALEVLVGPQGGRVIRVTPWLLIVSKG